jgi:hypothetical protein
VLVAVVVAVLGLVAVVVRVAVVVAVGVPGGGFRVVVRRGHLRTPVRPVWTTDCRADRPVRVERRKESSVVTAGPAEGERSAADRLGIAPGMLVQEVGRDDDADEALVASIAERTGTEPVAEDSDDVVDVVLLWFREDDGDLVDALMDARTRLDNNGAIWVLTPKAGRDGHVEPSDIIDAAPTAGLIQTSTVSASKDWAAAKLVVPKGQRSPRHR